MFDSIIKEATNRFNLGGKALPLVQVLVAAMTNKETQGLAGFIEKFKSNGLGLLVDSWIHTSAPLSINHAYIENVLGAKGDLLETITSKVGLDKETALMALAYLLPNVINQLAPNGKIPDTFSSEITDFAQKGMGLLAAADATTSAAIVTTGAVASAATTPAAPSGLFEGLIEDVKQHFNFGDKSLPFVQTVVAAMTNPATGGLAGFIEGFKKQGLGYLVDSWFQGSEPLNINHAQIEDVLGAKGGLLETIISRIGLDKGSALLGLGYVLPKLFNKLAPGGNIASPAHPDVSRFAEKGLALLGIGSVAAGAVTMNKPAPAPMPPPARPPVPEPIPVAVPAPRPVPAPIVKPVPLAKTPPIPAAVVAEEANAGGNIWKSLLWLLPVVLGLWLLKSCSNPTEEATTNTATAPVATTPDNSKLTQTLPTATPVTVPVTEVDKAATQAKKVVEPAAVAVNTPSPVTASPEPIHTEPTEVKPSTDAAMSVPNATLYFQVSKTALPTDAKEKLAPVLKYIKAHKAAKVSIAGFHDPSGNQAANEQLAKNRAKQVKAKLRAAGIAETKIMMEKPQSTTGTGSNDEARRVEVSIQQ